jgi:hypothetical protein
MTEISRNTQLAQLPNQEINVKDFGAVGDGVTDDTSALQSAIAAALATIPTSAVRVPVGVYKLSSQLTSTESVCIFGDGVEQTQLVWDGASTSQGLAISYSSSRDKAHPYIRDLSFVRDSAYGGTAISIDGSGSGGHADSQRAIIQNVRIDRSSVATDTGSWEYGIFATSVDGCYIDGCSFQGDNDQVSPSTDYYGTFIRITGTDADNEVNAHFNVTNTRANRAKYGIYASNCEGIYVDNFRYFNVDNGIKYDNVGATTSTTTSPRIMMTGGHIKPRFIGVELTYTTHTILRDIYFLDSNLTTTEHIKLANTLNSTIEGCHFEGLAGSTADGITITSSSFDNLITGCHFSGTGSNAIEIDSSSQSNSVGHNFFRFDNWGNYVVNNSPFLMWVGGSYRLKLDSTQTIPNNTGTAISWDSVNVSELGSSYSDLGTDATKLNIVRRGKYRVTCYLQFAANATGYRYLDIRVNGSNLLGSNGTTVMPQPTGNTRMSVVSDVLNLNNGDYITAYVEQTSGGNLDLQTNGTISIEYIGMR